MAPLKRMHLLNQYTRTWIADTALHEWYTYGSRNEETSKHPLSAGLCTRHCTDWVVSAYNLVL